jgi:hypothetical protein
MKKIKIPPVGGDEVISWLAENKIEYDHAGIVINPLTYEPMMDSIIIKNEKDYVLYMLRWS